MPYVVSAQKAPERVEDLEDLRDLQAAIAENGVARPQLTRRVLSRKVGGTKLSMESNTASRTAGPAFGVKSKDFTLPDWALLLLLVAAVLAAYWPVQNAGYVWDDDVYVTGNSLLTAPDGLRRIWFSLDSPSQYFPLTYTVLRIEYGLWGLQPLGYHVVNVLLHALNAILLWRLLRRLGIPGAWLGAALFALHPVNVESVAWVTELKNILSLLFYLLAMRAWVEFIEEPGTHKMRYYFLALLCAALAICGKTTACTLPAALVLLLWWQGKKFDWRRILQIAPFLLLGLGMGLVAVWWERYHQNAAGAAFNIGLLDRFLIANRAIWFYLGKFIWPAHLAFSYPQWKIDPHDLTAWIWPTATLAAAVVVWRTRGLLRRALAVTLLFYGAALSPLLGFIMEYTFRYTFVADHYQYIAMIAPCALVGAGVARARSLAKSKMGWIGAVAAAGVLLVFGCLTHRQCGFYADSEALWRATLAENPTAAIARNNLADALAQKGKFDESMAVSSAMLETDADNATAHNNLGFGLLEKGRLDEAIPQFEKVITLEPGNPRAYYNLGLVNLKKQDFTNAISWFQQAIARKADHPEAWCNLAFALMQLRRTEEAVAADEKALAIKPDYALAHNDLGSMLLQAGHADVALPHFERAAALQPNFLEAQFNMGEALLMLGRREEAIGHYRIALKIRPNFPQAANRLVQLTQGQNQPPH
jgi:protein O-mannosyl-transferase